MPHVNSADDAMEEPVQLATERLQRIPIPEQVARQIQQSIERLGLKSGDWLPTEAQLSEQFGVSRRTVREAIKRLEGLGLVEARAGQRTTLKNPDPFRAYFDVALANHPWLARQEMLAELRETVEEGMLSLVLRRITPEQIASLERANAGCWGSLHDPESFIEYDLEFHALLYRASRNELVAALVPFVEEHFALKRRAYAELRIPQDDLQRAAREHAAILEALRNRNLRGARAAARRHQHTWAKRAPAWGQEGDSESAASAP